MTTTGTTSIADAITPGYGMTLALAQLLVDGIDPASFARCPDGAPTMNHPAFVIGHLSIYPDRLFQFTGNASLAKPREGFEELFSASARCRDDADGSIYPSKDEIVGHFTERHEALRGVLADLSDDLLAREMPEERYRERLPTIGAAVTFLTGPHVMMHLGQLSSWRRAMGLGPAMPHSGG